MANPKKKVKASPLKVSNLLLTELDLDGWKLLSERVVDNEGLTTLGLKQGKGVLILTIYKYFTTPGNFAPDSNPSVQTSTSQDFCPDAVLIQKDGKWTTR